MSGLKLKSLKKCEVENILREIDTILCDCDGVLCVLKDVIAGGPETVEQLKKSGKQFFYVTNNPTVTRKEFSKNIKSLGYDVEVENVICAAYLIANYLKSINFRKKVYLVGCDGIGKELDSAGIKHTGIGPDIVAPDLGTVVNTFEPDKEIGAVVVSFDGHISYPKLMKAATYLNDPNVLFIASSMDIQVPVSNSKSIPGPGALVRCIEACSGRTATVLGKPEPYVRQVITETFDIVPERTLMIGDSAHSDILLGKRCGFKTLLVLTGVTKEEDLQVWKDALANSEMRELIPDFYTDSIADISSCLASSLVIV